MIRTRVLNQANDYSTDYGFVLNSFRSGDNI